MHSQCAARQQCVEGRCTVPVDAGRPEAGPDATLPDAASLDAAASDAIALDAVHSDVIHLDTAAADSGAQLDAMVLDAIATDMGARDVHCCSLMQTQWLVMQVQLMLMERSPLLMAARSVTKNHSGLLFLTLRDAKSSWLARRWGS